MGRKVDITKKKFWNINGVRWKVKYVPKGSPYLCGDNCGLADFAVQTIFMRLGMGYPMTLKTLCHELAHCCGVKEGGAESCEILIGILMEHKIF